MANIGEITIGMSAKHGQLKKDLGQSSGHLGVFAAKAGAAGAVAGVALSRGLDAAGGAVVGLMGRAMDLEDELSKVGVIFGPEADRITSKADAMAEQFGASRTEYIRAATSFGSVFKGLGQSQGEAADLGNQLAQLGMDMASFEGVASEEAFGAIASALRGEMDPIERFRVFLSAAKIEAKALEMGLVDAGGAVTEAGKKSATVALIMEQTADAQGDLARTADQSKNQWNLFTGSLANAGEMVASAILPAFNEATKWLNSKLGPAIEWVGFVVRNFGDIWEIATLQMTGRIANLIEWVGIIPENLSQLADYVAGNWRSMLLDSINAVSAGFSNLGTNLAGLASAIMDFLMDPTGGFAFEWTPLLDGFRATTEALPGIIRPTLTDMGDEIATVTARISARELERSAGKAGEAVATAAADAVASAPELAAEAPAAEAAARASGPSLGGAMEAGSEEARRTLLDFRMANSAEDAVARAADATARNTSQIAGSLKRIERSASGGGETIIIPA